MKLDLHYVDPRLVALYDSANSWGADSDFYLQLADELGAETIVDLGCGTGLLTTALAVGARTVIGIDPAPAMLAIAQQRLGAERVRWLEGDSSQLVGLQADLVLMTGNVAQVFLDDQEWRTVLQRIYAALPVGGYLAFESRNPLARVWEQWRRDTTYTVSDSPYGPLEEWLEVVDVAAGCVHLQGYNIFQTTGETLIVESKLRFRTSAELCESLSTAGFTIAHLYGNWHRAPLTDKSPIIVIVAQRHQSSVA